MAGTARTCWHQQPSTPAQSFEPLASRYWPCYSCWRLASKCFSLPLSHLKRCKRRLQVQFEHAILGQLNQQKLSFEVPSVLPSKHGRPHELLSSGTECCVFNIIPGQLAKTTSPQEVGRATGELCSAMGKIKVDMVPPIAPYWDLFRCHHAVKTSDVFYAEVARNAAFDKCRESIDFLVGEIKKIEPKLVEFKNGGLPQQIIHGDLHYDNVMTLGDTVRVMVQISIYGHNQAAVCKPRRACAGREHPEVKPGAGAPCPIAICARPLWPPSPPPSVCRCLACWTLSSAPTTCALWSWRCVHKLSMGETCRSVTAILHCPVIFVQGTCNCECLALLISLTHWSHAAGCPVQVCGRG